jgi:hypothetical protein
MADSKPPPTSPLLWCPPEIRNAIYEELFLHKDPIQLARPAHKSGDSCDSHQLRGSIPGINLLATCRQFKLEASGPLYSQNTFLISAHEDLLQHWKDDIGDNKILLRTIHLNLGPTAWSGIWDVDIKPIFRELWRRSPGSKIRFVFFEEKPSDWTGNLSPAANANNMLLKLGPDVSPQLEYLARSERTVESVWMQDDGSCVFFFLNTNSSDNSRGRSLLTYDLSNAGELVRGNYPDTRPNLTSTIYLPAMHRALSDLFPYSRKPVVFDLTSNTISRSWPAIVHVNRKLRDFFLSIHSRYWVGWDPRFKTRETRFKIQMKSEELRTEFDRFTALKSWASNGRPLRTYQRCCPIVLSFETSNPNISIDDLRIEVTELMVATLSLSLETTISVQLHRYRLNGGQRESVRKAHSTVYCLRRALLVFLFEVITAQRSRQGDTCPKIWVDGQLRIREAEFCSGDGNAVFMTNSIFKWESGKLNKAKEKIISQLVDDKLHRRNFRRYWEDRFRKDDEVDKKHETLLSFTVFLALIVKVLAHPEHQRRNTRRPCSFWNDDIIDYAPDLELRELRP